jgi:hypothetical protein
MTAGPSRRASRFVRLAGGAAIVTSAVAGAKTARAWYFPEHVIIAHDGVMELPREIRDVLEDAVVRARGEGLPLCARIDLPLEEFAQKTPIATRMLLAKRGVDCVPYTTLPALAGDHANSATELRRVVTTAKGLEIVSAVAYEWSKFEEALGRLPNAPLERMSFVHSLDVDLYFIDPGYELRAQATHAHFTDAGATLEEAVRSAGATGKVDTALAQLLAHHLRSLQLAARGRVAEAILEHGFAMHFLQDAFAAGHLVMTEDSWRRGNGSARRRHDFFNAKGLAVGRAMAVEPCPALAAGSLELSGLTPCWVTSGDGYLGTSADASDRLHAARAATKAELEFALALSPDRVLTAVEAFGEREQIALGQLIEPDPWWTVGASERRELGASASRTLRLIRGAIAAIAHLRDDATVPEVEVGASTSPGVPGLFDPRVMEGALDACVPATTVDPSLVDPSDTAPCAPGESPRLGAVGTSLLRPLLVEWPSSQVPPWQLSGESNQDFGWAVQLLASANASVLFPPGRPIEVFAPAVGVAAGLSYRWGTYLPGRLNRSVGELNVGISEALQYDGHGQSGGHPHVTFLDQELRWPIAWELLTSYKLPLDIARGHEAGGVLLLNGVRVHEMVTNPTPVFWGIEVEVAAIALSRGQGRYPLYAASPELRLYLGAASPSAAQPSDRSKWGPTIGLEFIGGYATFL